MRLLVHIAGEADLLLDSSNERSEGVRVDRISERRNELATKLESPGGASAVRRKLIDSGWDQPFSTPPPSPIFGVLDWIHSTSDGSKLDVVVLGTAQERRDPLDTLPIAQTLARVLNGIAAEDDSYPVRQATAVTTHGLVEASVVKALSDHLAKAPRYRQALLTWGSGATKLALGTLTALSRAGLPWRLVHTSSPATYEIIDPLDQLGVDPVVGVLVRWRMFAALDAAAREDPPAVQLNSAQRDLVRRAAARRRAGLEARDCESLRAVLADAVVRRDGTASLAVRRYITRRYEELLNKDRLTRPNAVDLFKKFGGSGRGGPVGKTLDLIRKKKHDEEIRRSIGLCSYEWLHEPEVDALREIGNGSHNLRPPADRHAKIVGRYLSQYNVDGNGWQENELPKPPVTPTDTVLTVWLAGVKPGPNVRTIGQQLCEDGLPTALTNHLGVEKPRIRAVVFGIHGSPDSIARAEVDAKLVSESGHEASPELVSSSSSDPETIERTIERRICAETAALLLIPTGYKPGTLSLLRAMRRVGARHGLPLFVRQIADPAAPDDNTDRAPSRDQINGGEVHLWPALTGGDLPLLNAAKGALEALELDVAWRLLAASAIDPKTTEAARRLAAAFASREPLPKSSEAGSESATKGDASDWTTKMISQRLELVKQALTHCTTPADRIRLLVLAADTMNASFGALQQMQQPDNENQNAMYDDFRTALHNQGSPNSQSARVLLLLSRARNRAPITHGTATDPDAIVADMADLYASKWNLNSAQAAQLPRDVAALLRCAVSAAADRDLGQAGQSDSLLTLHRQIVKDVDAAIRQRALQQHRTPTASTPLPDGLPAPRQGQPLDTESDSSKPTL